MRTQSARTGVNSAPIPHRSAREQVPRTCCSKHAETTPPPSAIPRASATALEAHRGAAWHDDHHRLSDGNSTESSTSTISGGGTYCDSGHRTRPRNPGCTPGHQRRQHRRNGRHLDDLASLPYCRVIAPAMARTDNAIRGSAFGPVVGVDEVDSGCRRGLHFAQVVLAPVH